MKKVFLVMITLFFMSCNNLDMKKPSNLIPENQMVEILYDLVLMNSAKSVNKQLLEKNIQNPQAYIYKKYNIDSLQFVESNAYYSFKSDVYKSIYEKLELKLTTQKTAHEALVKEKKRVKDSIRKSKLPKVDTLSEKYQKKFKSKTKPLLKKTDKLQQLPLK